MDHKPKQRYGGACPPPWQRDKNWMVYIRGGIFYTHLRLIYFTLPKYDKIPQ